MQVIWKVVLTLVKSDGRGLSEGHLATCLVHPTTLGSKFNCINIFWLGNWVLHLVGWPDFFRHTIYPGSSWTWCRFVLKNEPRLVYRKPDSWVKLRLIYFFASLVDYSCCGFRLGLSLDYFASVWVRLIF